MRALPRHLLLPLLASLPLYAAASAGHAGGPLPPAGEDDPGILDRFPLELPAGTPEFFRVALPLEGRTETLLLSRHSLRAAGAELLVYRADGTTESRELPPVRTYRGEFVGMPRWKVLASLTEAGLRARIVDGGEILWSIRPAPRRAAVRGATIEHELLSGEPESEWNGECGAMETTNYPGTTVSGVARIDALPIGPCQHLAEIAFDADYEFYLAQGGTVNATVARIEDHLNVVDLYYARDVKIVHELTTVIVRTAPFYSPTGGGDLLNLFRSEWETNLPHIPRDLAHLMTGKPGSLIEYGGLAWVGVVCGSSAYAWSMDGANIVGHEIGHNWGAGHCHDLTPCNNMCGACYYIAPITKGIIIDFRDSRGCLDVIEAYVTPLAPYGHPDELVVGKDRLAQGTPIPIDVLVNDHDGNCQGIRIEGLTSPTPRGATLAVSPGTGTDGLDELLYLPPAEVFVGTDAFTYVVGDGTGQQATGEVTVEVLPLGFTGWWKLNDGGGTTAFDEAAEPHHGNVFGSPIWTAGNFGGGLAFDGIDDFVTIPVLGLYTNTLTITTWLKRDGPQVPLSGIVFSRAGGTIAGLMFRDGYELGYNWNNQASAYDFSSGLIPPDQQMVFVALVVEPDAARFYLHDGTSMQTAVNPASHGREQFNGPTRIGKDDWGAGRFARMELDDVRIYRRALGVVELTELAELGGRAQAPEPKDGGQGLAEAIELSWEPGLLADSHDLYLGTGYVAVHQATTASAEYLGNQSGTTFDPGLLATATTFYWRIDERVGASVVHGETWQFSTLSCFHWKLDETSGTTASEERSIHDGIFQGGPALGQLGATPSTGNAVDFDGVDDSVLVPSALNLYTNQVTFTTWVRRDGDQTEYPGLVFSRDQNTLTGMHIGRNQQLGYVWNNHFYTWYWDSGLVVPDQTWVFAALVVEPNQATMYLGDGGMLSTSVHLHDHVIEEFDGELDFARDRHSSIRSLNGMLDDIRIYDAALSPEMVQALYESY